MYSYIYLYTSPYQVWRIPIFHSTWYGEALRSMGMDYYEAVWSDMERRRFVFVTTQYVPVHTGVYFYKRED